MRLNSTHLILDGARITSQMQEARARAGSYESLYRGQPSLQELDDLAPTLFTCHTPAAFSIWYLHNGWGDAWGVLIKSSWPLQEIAKHFRKFIYAHNEENRQYFFRFYDPRVLRAFLPTCDTAQIRAFFGYAIDYFIVEDKDPAYALRFSHQNGILQTERFSVSEQIAQLPIPEPLPPEEEPLPPETLAYLQQTQMQQAQEQPVPKPDTTDTAGPQTSSSSPPKPKSKWNTFDD